MANRLTKLIGATYAPAIPEQPARAAYCYAPRGQYYDALSAWHSYLDGRPYDDAQLLCFPAIPYSPGRDAEVNTSANLGWNAGAASRAIAGANCIMRFKIVPGSAGVLAGVARASSPTGSFNAITHGVLFTGGTLRIVEAGIEKANSGVSLSESTVIEIRRSGRVVTYRIGAWRYTSTLESAGDVRLAAVLYAAGDAVTEPSLQSIESLHAQAGWGWTDPASQGRLKAQASWGWGGRAEFNEGRVSLPLRVSARMSEDDYGDMRLDVGGVRVEASAGFTEVDFSILSAVIPMAHAVQGSLVLGGDIDARFGVIALGADHDYSTLSGEVAPIAVRGLDLGEAPGTGSYFERLRPRDTYHFDSVIYALMAETLHIGSAIDVLIAMDADVVECLALDDQLDVRLIITALIQSGLKISDNASHLRRELVQYATNLANGAVSRYSGYDFLGFTKHGMHAYGWRRDGVYRLGGPSDDGDMLRAVVEFAAQDFGVANHKRLDSLLIGADTDGQLFVKITDDHGISTTHPVQARGSEVRALLPKGRSSRYWRASLIIEDATEARIDNIEWVVGTTTRRTTR